jgi:hypothetical protein
MPTLKALKADPKRTALLAAALICLLGGSLLVRVVPTTSALAHSSEMHAGARSFAQAEQSFMTLSDFVNRSPGERGEVDPISGLIKSASVFERDGSSIMEPSQRALGKIFDPEPSGIAALQEGPIELLTGPLDALGAPGSFGPVTGSPSPFPPGGGSGPGGFPGIPPSIAPGGGGGIGGGSGGGIGGGGGSGGGGGAGGGSMPPPPVAGVPEPDTWALMLMGFFAAGFAMRRSSAKTKRPITRVAL